MTAGSPKPRRSFVTGWTLGVLAIMLAGLVALGLLVDGIVARNTQTVVARGVDTDMAGLIDIYASSGQQELARRIDDRTAVPMQGQDTRHYLLASADGTRIAGDIARWPALSAETSESGWLRIDGVGKVHARATMLEPGVRLLVAHGYAARSALRHDIRTGFIVAAALLLVLIVGYAWLWAGRLRRRIDDVGRQMRAIGDAHPEARETTHPPDEIGDLARQTDRLAQRIEALLSSHRQVSNNLAHEIRTPLLHLDNRLLELIARAEADPDREQLGAARHEIRDIVQLLEALLDIAAAQARSGDRSGMEEFDLTASLARLADVFDDSAEELGINFTADLAPGITFEGERPLIERMVANLLDNAFKFAREGDSVELVLRRGPEIIVRDSGPGIPDDMRERVFDRFERSATTARGHGLGLPLARAIANRHKLDLSLDPSSAMPGSGATFSIRPTGGTV